jgi:rhodanese-related sulfurtransferase
MQETTGIQDDRKTSIILIVVLIAIMVSLSLLYIFVENPFGQNIDGNTSKFTTSYQNVSPEDAYHIINTTNNLTIIDCRGLEGCSICQYKNDGHLAGAIRNDNPISLYNSTNDILVYSKDGSVGENFCSDLVGHVSGNIYNLEGGFNAWKEADYPLKYGAEP